MSAALQTPRTHIIPLGKRIVDVLTRARGKRLSTQQIAGALGMPLGNAGQEWQNNCALARELPLLTSRQKISYSVHPEEYWIERRDDGGGR